MPYDSIEGIVNAIYPRWQIQLLPAFLFCIFLVLNDKIDTPLKHELTHLIVMLGWGYPHQTSIWMNEGLSTSQVNNCNGYSVSELYRYFLDKNKFMILNLESPFIEIVIYDSCKIKKNIVQLDEKEKKLKRI